MNEYKNRYEQKEEEKRAKIIRRALIAIGLVGVGAAFYQTFKKGYNFGWSMGCAQAFRADEEVLTKYMSPAELEKFNEWIKMTYRSDELINFEGAKDIYDCAKKIRSRM